MKFRSLVFCLLFLPLVAFRSDVLPEFGPAHFYGAWQADIEEGKIVKIYTPSWYVYGVYTPKKFISAGGGTWEMTAKGITETYEFHTVDPDLVGTTLEHRFKGNHDGDRVVLKTGSGDLEWNRVDDGSNDMFGAYRFKSRMRNGEMSKMRTGPRKTMKVLSGTRFQWAAINTETKEFFGTGGGTYTSKDGKYTENIEFFSRDNSRVGASLEFDYEIKDGDWHHSGKSSKGDPMYEVWGNQDK